MDTFRIDEIWRPERADTLVVGCSDGQLQEETDLFVRDHLGVTRYDRLYIPGGAGALCPSGAEFTRAHQVRRECTFLISAHEIKRVVLLFHGPAADGPDAAICGDYQRKLPALSSADIRRQQEQDAKELLRSGFGRGIRIDLLRCEVGADGSVSFVPIGIG